MSCIKNYFSGFQLFWMSFLFDVGMPIVIVVGPTIKLAQQNAWASAILGIMCGIYPIFVAVLLNKIFPNQSLVQYCRTILGPWFGIAFSICYVAQWTLVSGIALRQVVNFIGITQYPKTPLWMIALCISVAIWYILHFASGIETVGRMSNILGPLVLILSTLVVIASVSNVRWERLLPVDIIQEWNSVAAGSTPAGAFFAQSFVFSMIFPFLQRPMHQAMRSVWGLVFAGIYFSTAIVWSVGTLGPILPGKLVSPVYTGTTFIAIAEFIQNLDTFVIMLWLLSATVRLIIYQFAASYGWAQIFGLKNWQITVVPMLVVQFAIALVPRNNAETTIEFTKSFVEGIVYPYLLLIGPTFLIVVALLRRYLRPAWRGRT